jgi:uncharacterized protein
MAKKKRLAGQRALVTGASSGIGAEIAKELAKEGANLVLVARRVERLEALAKEIKETYGVEAKPMAFDLGKADAAQALFDQTEGEGLEIDVLVNNAGFGAYEDFVNVDWDRYAGMIQLNIVALTQASRAWLPKMIARRHGYLMNIASVGAYTPCPTFAVYAATKAYVRNLTEAISFELKGTGVNAICVNPGGTRTEFLDAADQVLKKTGEMAMMTAEECARIAVKKMLAGRRNVITGFMNALSMFIMRFLPRPWMTWFAYQGMKAGVEKGPKKALPAPPE